MTKKKKDRPPSPDRAQSPYPVKVREIKCLVAVCDVLGEPDATVLVLYDHAGRHLGSLADLNLSAESIAAWQEVLR